jgi:phospholipid/cholesterol/gamma-HCH transport system permease protein
MTRELAAVMAGVIMAGRTGAAYAAQLGSMKVNEEIDALKTFGISPMSFLVLPRVIALVVMMPLLCILADIISIFGGLMVSVSVSELSVTSYLLATKNAVSVTDVMVGVFKSGLFGIIIAIAGCYRGLNCGKDAASVGNATTSAGVTAITWIVIVDAAFAVIFHILGI